MIVSVQDTKYYINNTQDFIENYLSRGKRWNDILLRAIETYVSNNSIEVVFVIGAHIGTTVIPLSRIVSKVYCFEPHSRTFKHLTANIKLNNSTNIKAYNIALGDANSNGFMLDIASDRLRNNSGGMHCVTSEEIAHNQRSSHLVDSNENVEIRKSDDVCKEQHIDRVDLLLIDIEGMEYAMFEGAKETISTLRPRLIICELWDDRKRSMEKMSHTQQEMVEYIEHFGYKNVSSIDDDFIFECISE